MSALTLTIVTPRKTVYSGGVKSVTAPGTVGSFQVLHNHAPLLSSLRSGELKFVDSHNQQAHFAVSGGFLEVRSNVVTVLAETAESRAEIDVPRAERARDRAEERLHTRGDRSIDRDRAQAALDRATNRLTLAARNN